MIGKAWELRVKNLRTGEWDIIGPCLRWYGFFQFEDSVNEYAEIFNNLGLETEIREFETEYDDR